MLPIKSRMQRQGQKNMKKHEKKAFFNALILMHITEVFGGFMVYFGGFMVYYGGFMVYYGGFMVYCRFL